MPASDSNPSDSDRLDAGSSDAGSSDAGSSDAGSTDFGSTEQQPFDIEMQGEVVVPARNPYLPPGPDTQFEDIVLAEAVERRDPVWPAFVVVIGAILASLVLSVIALVGAAAATGNLQAMRDPELQQEWVAEFAGSSVGLSVLVLPGQIVFAAFGLVAAVLMRGSWVDRLGLRMGRLPVWTWLLFMLGTPVIGMLSAQLLSSLIDEPSQQLKMLERMFQFDSLGAFVVLILLVSWLPGIAEELLFRGFMQRLLCKRFTALFSITICSFFFAAAHMDPMHALGVLPLGLWLGVIAWRADSIWPAICGHIGNNGYAIVMAQVMGSDAEMQDAPPAVLAVIGASLLSFAAAVAVLALLGQPKSSHETSPPEVA